jgi:hypothetical protein
MRPAVTLLVLASVPSACMPLGHGDDQVDAATDAEGSDAHDWDPPSPTRPVEGACPTGPRTGPFVHCVDELSAAPEASFGHDRMPDIVLGPPEGDPIGGSLDVVSLGCGGDITLDFGDQGIGDGPGVDFVVFENAFEYGDETFAEPAHVWVSHDGHTWSAFPCVVDAGWPPEGCAGIEPVHATADNGWATDPMRSGGDAFDLAELGLPWIRYVRLIDRTWQYYGDARWCGATGGFDLDAVAVMEHER